MAIGYCAFLYRLWRGTTSASSYGDSWRTMFLQRPHLHFNGRPQLIIIIHVL